MHCKQYCIPLWKFHQLHLYKKKEKVYVFLLFCSLEVLFLCYIICLLLKIFPDHKDFSPAPTDVSLLSYNLNKKATDKYFRNVHDLQLF